MADPDALRKEWARRVTAAYDGWPGWPAPDATAGLPTDAPAGATASGWSWGVPADELADVDVQLTLKRHTAETARVLGEERAYWGLDEKGD